MAPPSFSSCTQTLETNNVNLFGQRGKQWINNLPDIINTLSEKWQITHVQPVDNMSWNYVAKADSNEHGAVVLKISLDEHLIEDELKALAHFRGHGLVKMIAHDAEYHAVLLHQAVPGCSLRSLYLEDVEQTIKSYASVVEQLKSASYQGRHHFKHMRHWLKAFDRADANRLPKGLLKKAIEIKNKLLALDTAEFVLHGDLHHDNIVSEGEGWIAIDPKGIVGSIEFEVACFDFIKRTEMKSGLDIPKIFEGRLNLIAHQLQLDPHILKDWVFVRLVLGACWMIEDNGSADVFLTQIKEIFPAATH